MRDMFFGVVILGWTFVAAHAGTSEVAELFGAVHASLEQILSQIG